MKPLWKHQFYLDRLGYLDRWRLLLVEVLLEPRNLWLGLYWTAKPLKATRRSEGYYLHLYLCLIPCLPLHIMLRHYVPRRGPQEPAS